MLAAHNCLLLTREAQMCIMFRIAHCCAFAVEWCSDRQNDMSDLVQAVMLILVLVLVLVSPVLVNITVYRLAN